jgi:hypothetical protein
MMTFRTIIPALVTTLSASTGLLAQSAPKAGDFNFDLKLRMGATAGNLKDDLHAESMLGMGIEGSYALSSRGAVIGELAFYTFGGATGYDNTRLSGPIYIAGPTTTVGGHPIYLQTSSSVDYRKNTLQGFSLRGGYRGVISDLWSWQAGLSVDALKFRQEASGTLQPKVDPGPVNAGPYEGFAVTPTKTKTSVGAFAGVKLQIATHFSHEANLVSVGYGTADYQPFTYTRAAPPVDSETTPGLQ